jgi:hypothetical protein
MSGEPDKKCSRCGRTKPAAEFNWKQYGVRHSFCRPCLSQYQRERKAKKKGEGEGKP